MSHSGQWAAEFGMPFKVYIADLDQAGTADPVATENENTVGAIVWARSGAGTFTATLAGAFPADKTHFLSTLTGTRTSDDVLTFTHADTFSGESIIIVVKQ